MKREDILAMEAGRELDAVVAEKVMGWHARSKKWGGECDEYEDHWHDGQRFVYECAMFTPSTDISAAWEVVGKFKCYELSGIIFHTCKLWKKISQESFEYQGKSPPEAICKAALLAVLEGKIYET